MTRREELAGGIPQTTPLNARTLEVVKYPDYELEKVVYESRPNFHVPALLYLPTAGKAPYPAILFQMGHAANGPDRFPQQHAQAPPPTGSTAYYQKTHDLQTVGWRSRFRFSVTPTVLIFGRQGMLFPSDPDSVVSILEQTAARKRNAS